ncbi:MAG: c-type cytochrome [Aquabacterium sp.]|uniref:c-type cytochrome n=1 Tax=Aquabacterium sp. TaxID=1872578 RepID=UPI0025BC4692|nr:c-type cytochrome [Aquabacterium sp.]MBI3382074.1 c-type cytochrome [Aquabacterium sp.]
MQAHLDWLALGLAASLISLSATAAETPPLARGAYLVHGIGCADCHTPLKMGAHGPEPDFSRGLSGHPQDMKLAPPPAGRGGWVWGGSATNTAFHGPWGISYAANLTPDTETGLGAWTADQFVAAIRQGKHAGSGRPIAPPMPWQSFARLDDTDLRAIYAYLMAQQPIHNLVPEPSPPGSSQAHAHLK